MFSLAQRSQCSLASLHHSHTATGHIIRMTDFVAGIDGGGSKTRVILADLEGKELADISGAGSAMAPGRGDHSARIIGDLIRQAMADAFLSDERPRSIVAGVAGVGRIAESRALTAGLEDLELSDD